MAPEAGEAGNEVPSEDRRNQLLEIAVELISE